MSTDNIFDHIKTLPHDEQRQLADHLLNHLSQKQEEEEDDQDFSLYNLDIF
ncbi:hypothetical protein [Desulfotomaculum sp. 1211_IL3151]|uniref:hypothetical protein n=1 Tax=Desulfotomaculum sp. 1211_IL3151 TaxID=3084055 RepID=UPI002FD88FD2